MAGSSAQLAKPCISIFALPLPLPAMSMENGTAIDFGLAPGGTSVVGATSTTTPTASQTPFRQAAVVAEAPSSHSSPSAFFAFARHSAPAPSQVAGWSHAAAASRQTVPADTSRHVASQHEPGAQFANPASHCSPITESTTPLPAGLAVEVVVDDVVVVMLGPVVVVAMRDAIVVVLVAGTLVVVVMRDAIVVVLVAGTLVVVVGWQKHPLVQNPHESPTNAPPAE